MLEFSGEHDYRLRRPLREPAGRVGRPALDLTRTMNEPVALCTFLLILGTVAVSYAGFRSPGLEEKYIFRP